MLALFLGFAVLGSVIVNGRAEADAKPYLYNRKFSCFSLIQFTFYIHKVYNTFDYP